jgi:hypothetical protein
MGREALGRGAFDVAARLLGALESEPSIAATPGYAFNRAQAARFLANAGEAAYWYGRYLALAPKAADAGNVRELAGKLVATSPRSVRAEVLRRARLAWQRELEDMELERALRACPEVRLEVRFAHERAILGGTGFGFPGRIVFWDLPEGDSAASMWVVATAPAAPPGDVGGSPFLLLPAGRAIRVPVGPELSSPPVTFTLPSPEGFLPSPELATWQVEVTASWERNGPPVILVARRSNASLVELRSGAFDGPLSLGKKRRDASPEPVPLAFGPRAARPEEKNAPKGLLAAVVLPLRGGTLEAWGGPLSLFDVVNRFGRLTTEDGATRLWVRGETAGPALTSLATLTK